MFEDDYEFAKQTFLESYIHKFILLDDLIGQKYLRTDRQEYTIPEPTFQNRVFYGRLEQMRQIRNGYRDSLISEMEAAGSSALVMEQSFKQDIVTLKKYTSQYDENPVDHYLMSAAHCIPRFELQFALEKMQNSTRKIVDQQTIEFFSALSKLRDQYALLINMVEDIDQIAQLVAFDNLREREEMQNYIAS